MALYQIVSVKGSTVMRGVARLILPVADIGAIVTNIAKTSMQATDSNADMGTTTAGLRL